MNNTDSISKIANLIQKEFKHANGGISDMAGIVGATQASTDVRKKLLVCVAELGRRGAEPDALDKMEANLRMANAMGLVTDYTFNKIIDLLGGLQ